MERDPSQMTGHEITGWNIDRLATIEMSTGGRPGRGIILPLYEEVVKQLGNRPISLIAAEKLIERVKERNTVILMTGMGAMPFMPCGETDGPPGVASLARAISHGLKGLPLITSHERDFEAVGGSVRLAGLAVLDYGTAQKTTTRCAVMLPFPFANKEESKRIAKDIMDKYQPKAVISVETMGPNKKSVKHFGAGIASEGNDSRIPGLEFLFHEAQERGVLTIACLDRGNEMGSGNVEALVRRIVPAGDVCQCPCQGGSACAVKSDVPFPCAISNWGAYAVSAMLGYLLRKPEILQDEETERLIFEGCISYGSADGIHGSAILSADGVDISVQQAYIKMLRTTILNALSGTGIAGQTDK